MPLTDDDLDHIFTAWRAATNGPVQVIQLPEGCDPVEWFRECLAYSDSKEVYGIASGTESDVTEGEGGYRVLAITGNGPGSLQNAQFYYICHQVIPSLIDEILRLRTELVAYEGKV